MHRCEGIAFSAPEVQAFHPLILHDPAAGPQEPLLSRLQDNGVMGKGQGSPRIVFHETGCSVTGSGRGDGPPQPALCPIPHSSATLPPSTISFSLGVRKSQYLST